MFSFSYVLSMPHLIKMTPHSSFVSVSSFLTYQYQHKLKVNKLKRKHFKSDDQKYFLNIANLIYIFHHTFYFLNCLCKPVPTWCNLCVKKHNDLLTTDRKGLTRLRTHTARSGRLRHLRRLWLRRLWLQLLWRQRLWRVVATL